jgi:hypothetical protein
MVDMATRRMVTVLHHDPTMVLHQGEVTTTMTGTHILTGMMPSSANRTAGVASMVKFSAVMMIGKAIAVTSATARCRMHVHRT